jgi:hypothetical protein
MDRPEPETVHEQCCSGADQWKEARKEHQGWYWEMMRRNGLVGDDQGDDEEGEDR